MNERLFRRVRSIAGVRSVGTEGRSLIGMAVAKAEPSVVYINRVLGFL